MAKKELRLMPKKYKDKYGPRLPGNSFKLLAILKHALIRKYLQKKYKKESLYLNTAWKAELPLNTPDKKFNYIALVYDSVVEEMVRVDDTTAKFLLGGAKLVPYNPETTMVKKKMLYVNNTFLENPEEGNNNENQES